MKRRVFKNIFVLGLFAAIGTFAACSDDDNNGGGTDISRGNYLVAGVFDEATYFIPAPSLDSNDTVSIRGNNGFEYSNTFTHFVGTSHGLSGAKYGKGGAHMSRSFTIGADGRATTYGPEYEIPGGFNCVDVVGPYFVTVKYGTTLPDGTSGVTANFYNLTENTASNTSYMTTTGFDDADLNGRDIQLQGIGDMGNNSFMSALYTSDMDPDSVYVGQFSFDSNFKITLDRVFKDNRISVASAGSGSTRYTFIHKVENGDVYVFSAGNITNTTKLPGALRIKAGATTFDPSYHFNIADKSGDRRFRRVYQITDDYMLLEFYNESGVSSGLYGKYAVLKMSTKEFNWITGLPDENTIVSASWAFSINGKLYIGLTFADKYPAIYSFDYKTYTAKRGLTIKDVTSIAGIGFVEE